MKIIFAALLSVVIAGCAQQQPAVPAAESPAQLEVRVEPQQPNSGQDAKLIAVLRDASGKSISDADLKATAVMKMGDMGDMRESATFKWTGSRYEGAVKPSMAGEWDVTVEAMKGGKVIATQQIKLRAE
ncbi:MAG: FixH family protein [Acidobacteriales bacterium]|nr:FixH family protein [Terriglobales bacterium]